MEVYHASPWIPAEWIYAHGLPSRGLWLSDLFRVESGGLSAGVCAFAQSVVRQAREQPDAALILTTHCDQMRRGFDAAVDSQPDSPKRCFLFNLPATWQTPVAVEMFKAELERLGRFLVGLGGHSPTDEELREAVVRHARARDELLGQVGTGTTRGWIEAVARFHWDGPEGSRRAAPAAAQEPEDERLPAVRLALVGGPLPRSQWRLLDAIEAVGGQVVLCATEPGERNLWPVSDALPSGNRSEVLSFLARDYLTHCVEVSQRPNTPLYGWLGQRLGARRAQGIVLLHYVGCDLWRAEAQSLRETFGLPVLLLEADATTGGWQRTVGRIEAFVEALRS